MSWYQLLSIYKEGSDPTLTVPVPLTCPNDGEPYKMGPDGTRYCPFDGYKPDSHSALDQLEA